MKHSDDNFSYYNVIIYRTLLAKKICPPATRRIIANLVYIKMCQIDAAQEL